MWILSVWFSRSCWLIARSKVWHHLLCKYLPKIIVLKSLTLILLHQFEDLYVKKPTNFPAAQTVSIQFCIMSESNIISSQYRVPLSYPLVPWLNGFIDTYMMKTPGNKVFHYLSSLHLSDRREWIVLHDISFYDTPQVFFKFIFCRNVQGRRTSLAQTSIWKLLKPLYVWARIESWKRFLSKKDRLSIYVHKLKFLP